MAIVSGSLLGVVGVKISMKNVNQNDRLKITRAAYRKLQMVCGEPECDANGIPTPTLHFQDDDSESGLGLADARNFKKSCNIIIEDSMLTIEISDFSVLRMPLQSLALISLLSDEPCRLAFLGKTSLCSFQLGKDTERVTLFIELPSSDQANLIIKTIEAHTTTVSYPLPEKPLTSSVIPPRVSTKPNYLGGQQPKQLNVQPQSISTSSNKQAPSPILICENQLTQLVPTATAISDDEERANTSGKYASPVMTPPALGQKPPHMTGEEQILHKYPLETPPPIPSKPQWANTFINQAASINSPPTLAPKPAQRSINQQQEQIYKNQASPLQLPPITGKKPVPQPKFGKYFINPNQLPLDVKKELQFKLTDGNIGLESSRIFPNSLHRQKSQPMINDKKSPTVQKRTSLPPTSAELQCVTMPPAELSKSEAVISPVREPGAVPLSPESFLANVPQICNLKSRINDEQGSINVVTLNTNKPKKGNKSLYDKDGYLIMNIPAKAKTTSLSEGNNETLYEVPHETSQEEHDSLLPSPNVDFKRQSKIITDLYEEEKRYIIELQGLQSGLAAPGINRDSLRVIEKLYEFHRLTFCPILQAACTGSKRELGKAFTENRNNFKIYEELLLIRSRCLESPIMVPFLDRFLIPLTQLQKYKMALSIIQDREAGDEEILEEAKDVIHSTLVRADNYLLLDSISGSPFTPEQCGSLIHKGTVRIKSKILSRKDYYVILTETHLILAEKSPNQKKNKYSGCIRMDTLTYEGQNETSLTIKGALHPGNGKMSQFTLTAQNIEAAQSWIKAIKEVLEKCNSRPTVFDQPGTLV